MGKTKSMRSTSIIRGWNVCEFGIEILWIIWIVMYVIVNATYRLLVIVIKVRINIRVLVIPWNIRVMKLMMRNIYTILDGDILYISLYPYISHFSRAQSIALDADKLIRLDFFSAYNILSQEMNKFCLHDITV